MLSDLYSSTGSILDRASINQLAASNSSPSSRNIVLKASVILVVFKKEWGNILSYIYTQYIYPTIYKYKDIVEQYTGKGTAILMEDRATSYIARIIKALYNRNGII